MSAQREMTLQEWVYKLPPIHSARKEFDSMQATIAQQAALIDQCEKLLRRYFNETPMGHQPHMIAEPAHDLLAAIAAHKKG